MPSQMRKAQRVKEVFPITNGLFSKMNYVFRAEVTKSSLDIMFVTDYGKRNTSSIIEYIQGDDNYGKKLTDAQLTDLANIILEMYKEKWDKIGSIYDIEYDPIHNYLDEWEDTSEEVLDGDRTSSGTDATTYGKTISGSLSRSDVNHEERGSEEDSTVTRTDDLTKTETRNLENEKTQTDNLLATTTFGKTETRTDDLEQETSYGRTDTRTDNLTAQMTYGKTDTRTDNLSEDTSGSKTASDTNASTQSVYPFNSDTAYPTNTDSGTEGHTETTSGSKDNTGTQTNASTGSDTEHDTGTQTNALSGSDTVENTGTQTTALSGSDSTANTGTRTTVDENTGTVTIADEGTETTVGNKTVDTEVNSTGTRTETTSEGYTGTDRVVKSGSSTEDVTTNRDRSGRHFGNIGNLTSQKQIVEEINLWKWNYMREILDDVKEFCTLPVYLNATEWQRVEE